jgi:hypothetical protein
MRSPKVSPSLLIAGVVALFAGAQLVPYGRQHQNPPVAGEPAWDSPATRQLAARACFDCHSNETRWPTYSVVAPASWLIYHDVVEGREILNLSEWQRPQEEAGEAADAIREMEMPPFIYRLMHPEARLTEAERETLAQGFATMFGSAHAKNVKLPAPAEP